MDTRCPKNEKNGHQMSKKQQEENRRSYKAIKKETIINPDTGEIKEKTKFVDMLFSKKGYIYECNDNYLKLPFKRSLVNKCSWTDCGKFYGLIGFIVGENQLLGYRSSKIKPLTVEKMSKFFKCSDRQTRRFLMEMKEKKVIKEVLINDIKWFAINPQYAMKNKRISPIAFMIFKEELMPTMSNKVINEYMQEIREIADRIEVKK